MLKQCNHIYGTRLCSVLHNVYGVMVQRVAISVAFVKKQQMPLSQTVKNRCLRLAGLWRPDQDATVGTRFRPRRPPRSLELGNIAARGRELPPHPSMARRSDDGGTRSVEVHS